MAADAIATIWMLGGRLNMIDIESVPSFFEA